MKYLRYNLVYTRAEAIRIEKIPFSACRDFADRIVCNRVCSFICLIFGPEEGLIICIRV